MATQYEAPATPNMVRAVRRALRTRNANHGGRTPRRAAVARPRGEAPAAPAAPARRGSCVPRAPRSKLRGVTEKAPAAPADPARRRLDSFRYISVTPAQQGLAARRRLPSCTQEADLLHAGAAARRRPSPLPTGSACAQEARLLRLLHCRRTSRVLSRRVRAPTGSLQRRV